MARIDESNFLLCADTAVAASLCRGARARARARSLFVGRPASGGLPTWMTDAPAIPRVVEALVPSGLSTLVRRLTSRIRGTATTLPFSLPARDPCLCYRLLDL
jgi:hypothetical protein